MGNAPRVPKTYRGVNPNGIFETHRSPKGWDADTDLTTESAIEPLPNLTTEALRQVDTRNDIRSLVLASLESDPRLRRHSPELKGEIDRALTKGAKGMYATPRRPLYARSVTKSSKGSDGCSANWTLCLGSELLGPSGKRFRIYRRH